LKKTANFSTITLWQTRDIWIAEYLQHGGTPVALQKRRVLLPETKAGNGRTVRINELMNTMRKPMHCPAL